MSIIKNIREFHFLIRIWEWMNTYYVVFLPPILLAGLKGEITPDVGKELSLLMLFVMFLFTYGFLLNSYSDRAEDKKVRKAVIVDQYSKSFIMGFLITLVVVGLLILFLLKNKNIALLGILELILATAYSIRPIRLKERGILGLALLILTMIPIPFLMLSMLLKPGMSFFIGYMLFCFLYSSLDETSHQYRDAKRDEYAEVKTWIAKKTDRGRVFLALRIISITLFLTPIIFFFILPAWQALILLPFLIFAVLTIYRHEYLIFKKKKRKQPTHVYISKECNNNCKECYKEHYQAIDDIDQLKQIIKNDSIVYDDIVFSGKEPALNKALPSLIKVAKNSGYRDITIESNGRAFFYEKFAHKIVDAGAGSFVITLFGRTPKEHDAFTGVNNSFSQSLEGIRNLKKMKQNVVVKMYRNGRISKLISRQVNRLF